MTLEQVKLSYQYRPNGAVLYEKPVMPFPMHAILRAMSFPATVCAKPCRNKCEAYSLNEVDHCL